MEDADLVGLHSFAQIGRNISLSIREDFLEKAFYDKVNFLLCLQHLPAESEAALTHIFHKNLLDIGYSLIKTS